jgi:hypothetical protein
MATEIRETRRLHRLTLRMNSETVYKRLTIKDVYGTAVASGYHGQHNAILEPEGIPRVLAEWVVGSRLFACPRHPVRVLWINIRIVLRLIPATERNTISELPALLDETLS